MTIKTKIVEDVREDLIKDVGEDLIKDVKEDVKEDREIYLETGDEESVHRCGFVTLIGAPNVGKSTLLNHMIGEHLAITSRRPQTTRNRIPGVLSLDHAQLIFIDTPGLHQGKSALNRYMDRIAQEAMGDTDLVALLIEAGVGPELQVGVSTVARRVLDAMRDRGQRIFLIINKIDRIPRDHLLPIIDTYRDIYPFEHIVPVSALKGDGVDRLIQLFITMLPEGPALYPKDLLTALHSSPLV